MSLTTVAAKWRFYAKTEVFNSKFRFSSTPSCSSRQDECNGVFVFRNWPIFRDLSHNWPLFLVTIWPIKAQIFKNAVKIEILIWKFSFWTDHRVSQAMTNPRVLYLFTLWRNWEFVAWLRDKSLKKALKTYPWWPYCTNMKCWPLYQFHHVKANTLAVILLIFTRNLQFWACFCGATLSEISKF